MELDAETLQKYSNRTGMAFEPVHESNNAVIILLPETTNMESVIDMNLPTAVIAGNIESVKNTALEIGYPEEAIIIYENMRYLTLSGVELFQGQGITLKNIIQIANYIHDNDIRPEIYVWKPNTKTEQESEAKINIKKEPEPRQGKEPRQERQGTEGGRPEVKQELKQEPRQKLHQEEVRHQEVPHLDYPKPKREYSKFEDNAPIGRVEKKHQIEEKNYTQKPKIQTILLTELVNKSKNSILVLKTIPESESGEITYTLANKINALHVDITGGPGNSNYGNSKEEALCTQKYAYSSDGENIELAIGHPEVVIYEIDANFLKPELLQTLYETADVIFHVPADFINSKSSIDLWVESRFRLDGIITTQDHNQYVAAWPAQSVTLDQALSIITAKL